MKKIYIAPAVELQETETFNMMALSITDKPADGNQPVLSPAEEEWNIWEEDAE